MTPPRIVRFAALVAVVVLATIGPAFAQSQPEKPASQPPHQHPAPTTGEQKRDLPPFIPPVTDEDRKAAFPDIEGHTLHDESLHSFVLLDQFEWQAGGGANGLSIDSRGWVGGDRDRIWFRAEGTGRDGRAEDAQGHLLYGRAIARWWDLVLGVRHDLRPGSPQTWGAIGIQGLAPHWFEVEATAYIGAGGRAHARLEVEYELLFTNRLVLQPLLEADVFTQDDRERRIGAGLSATDLGARLRYEFKRELAPYVGLTWNRKWGKTADLARAAGEDTGGARFVTGLRFWF